MEHGRTVSPRKGKYESRYRARERAEMPTTRKMAFANVAPVSDLTISFPPSAIMPQFTPPIMRNKMASAYILCFQKWVMDILLFNSRKKRNPDLKLE